MALKKLLLPNDYENNFSNITISQNSKTKTIIMYNIFSSIQKSYKI